MTIIYTLHYWYKGLYDYSSCYNYTVLDNVETAPIDLIRFLNSYNNMGGFLEGNIKDVILTGLEYKLNYKHLPGVKEEKDINTHIAHVIDGRTHLFEYLDIFATINVHQLAYGQYNGTYSGPPDEVQSVYRKNKDGLVYCAAGMDFLANKMFLPSKDINLYKPCVFGVFSQLQKKYQDKH